MTKEQQEFDLLKSNFLHIAEALTDAIKQITYEQYKDPEWYSSFLKLRSALTEGAINFGHFRFKACLEKDLLALLRSK